MYVSLAIFAFASLTDVFDGKIARRFHMESAVGAALDPLADKLLQLTAVLCLCINGNVFWLFPALIGIRELYQIIMASVLVNRNIVGKANYWGKSAALCVAIGIICSTLGGTYAPLFKGGLLEEGVFGSWILSAAGDTEAALAGAQTAGMAFYWVAFCFLVVGTVLGYMAAGSYTYIVVKQIGKENFKTAKDIRMDYFHNSSEKTESREELNEKKATEEQEAEADETKDNTVDED